MAKYFILPALLLAIGFGAQAQFKFGAAAGYERISMRPYPNGNSGGGFCGALQSHYGISRHWEVHLEFSVGVWKSEPFTFQSAGNINSSREVTTRASTFQLLAPLHFCYVMPFKKISLFAGPGFYWSYVYMTGGFDDANIGSFGFSMLAGMRYGRWEISANYRPWLHYYNIQKGYPNYYPYNGKLSNNIAVKIGISFGAVQRNKQVDRVH